jgi:nucleoside-diphosphate-sugar epimerase
MSERVLVTGGAGFIGSHVAAELVERGYRGVVLDDQGNVRDKALAMTYGTVGERPDCPGLWRNTCPRRS